MSFIAWCLVLLCCLSGCSQNKITHTEIAENSAQSEEAAVRESDDYEAIQESQQTDETTAKSEDVSLLSSVEDIDFHTVDETGRNYAFSYDNEEFSAQYTEDNWKIVNSYKITNVKDITLICQALLSVHPVHGRDMQSVRTAEDMAFEWLQHNLAYEFLPEDSPWKQNAKDVDLNPADQGKSIQEIYEDRTGRKFRMEDFIK